LSLVTDERWERTFPEVYASGTERLTSKSPNGKDFMPIAVWAAGLSFTIVAGLPIQFLDTIQPPTIQQSKVRPQ
jgi:hypothetical protein